MTNSALQRFVEELESYVATEGELILSTVAWPLGEETPKYDAADHYRGMTSDFQEIVRRVSPTVEDWVQLHIAVLTTLAGGTGECYERLERLGEQLWMKSCFGELEVWHTAFPPLDGGGASLARTVRRLLRDKGLGRRKCCFEWCCGPGFLGFQALKFGFCEELVLADVNPRVEAGIRRTTRENGFEGRVRFYLSDNLKNVPSNEKFDLVLGNPPWAYREIPGLANPLIPNDPGWQLHRNFFGDIGAHLCEEAELLISCFRPFDTEAFIGEQNEVWDVRPCPPVQSFRQFALDGGLRLKRVVKLLSDPLAEFSDGVAFLELDKRAEPELALDLLGLGGEESGGVSVGLSDPKEFRFLLEAEPLAGFRRYQALQYLVGSHLAARPLREFLSDFFGQRAMDYELLEGLGLAKQIVAHFGEGDAKVGLGTGFKLLEESAWSEVRQIRLQLTQDAPVCVGLKALVALLKAFRDQLSFVVTVKPGANELTFSRVLAECVGEEQAHRVAVWGMGHQTLFAQDSAKLVVDPEGNRALWIPRQGSSHRAADRMGAGLLPLVFSALNWEGGNLLCDGRYTFVGANSVASSMRTLGLDLDQVLEVFEAESGFPAVVLGSVELALKTFALMERGVGVEHAVDGGQADFHIDVDCCFLGASSRTEMPVVLLADPEAGLAYADEVLAQKSRFEGHFLSPEKARTLFLESLEKTVERRVGILAEYAMELKKRGYKVVRVPDLRLSADYNYLARKNFFFGYCNALLMRYQDRPTAALFPLGLTSLESEVSRLYAEFGVDLRWIGDSVLGEEMASMRGGLHCFCSVLQ